MAVHPDDAAVVAIGTTDGLYLSRDAGNTFERLAGGPQLLAETFDLDGRHLWFGAHGGRPELLRIELEAGARPQTLPLPPLGDDAVAYVAQNPARHDEIAIATFKRSVFLSRDQGRTWTRIADDGATTNG